jgi:membrane fusion protein (multidrug efflux system)
MDEPEEESIVTCKGPGRRRGQALLAVLLAGAGCAAFAGYLESSPPAAPAARSHAGAPADHEWIATTAGSLDADVRPAVAGRVWRRVMVEGSLVRRGDLLFEIDPRPFQARLDRARADLAQAPGTPSVEALRAAVEQARLDLAATAVRSPITGIAGAAQARVGDLVNPTSVVATVAGIDPIRVRFQLAERDYLRYLDGLRPGAAAERRFGNLELVLADGTAFPRPGRLSATGRQVDLATRTIGAEGLFPNPGNLLRPGRVARVHERTSP